jgi:hypothetical protein
MGKYSPLGVFLRAYWWQMIAGRSIDRADNRHKTHAKAQHHRAWWSNNPSNNVMTKVWLEAGFQTEQVDLGARKLVFRRVHGRGAAARLREPATTTQAVTSGSSRHPLLGALKGLMRVARGSDLTKPADPSWGEGA